MIDYKKKSKLVNPLAMKKGEEISLNAAAKAAAR